jgi:hypothetical protein
MAAGRKDRQGAEIRNDPRRTGRRASWGPSYNPHNAPFLGAAAGEFRSRARDRIAAGKSGASFHMGRSEFPRTGDARMILIRKAIDRGHADHGWLKARHTFSFANYHHPDHMGYRALRVINEDTVAPGAGFPPHSHRDMEIVTYVLDGALEHKDSTGGGGVIRPGDVQYMCAGTGVTHSEYNASKTEPVHLLQIWILPDAANHRPRYEQKAFGEERRGRLRLVASSDGRDGSIQINQSTDVCASVLDENAVVEHRFGPGRRGYLQLAKGGLEIGGVVMQAGDGAKISDETVVAAKALAPETEFLLFDLD